MKRRFLREAVRIILPISAIGLEAKLSFVCNHNCALYVCLRCKTSHQKMLFKMLGSISNVIDCNESEFEIDPMKVRFEKFEFLR